MGRPPGSTSADARRKVVIVRASAAEIEAWKRAMQRSLKPNLSEWVRTLLNEASEC
jgi:predicted outer membrane protein